MDIEPTRFSTLDPSSIRNFMRTKDQKWLRDRGGVEGMVSALETDVENGIPGDRSDIDSRRRKFGHNLCPEFRRAKHLRYAALDAFTDPMVIFLLVCSVFSLVFDIAKHGPKRGWNEGVANLVAILVVVAVSAGCKLWLTRLCWKYSDTSSYVPHVDVVRDGKWHQLPIPRIVVGDVVFLKPGDHVPGDGLFLDGCSLQVEILKLTDAKNARQVLDSHDQNGQSERQEVNRHENPFLFSGSRVIDGYAKMLVTAVGSHKKNHLILLNGTIVDEFKNLTSVIGKIGKAVALLTFLVLLARFFAGNIYDDHGNRVSFSGDMELIDVVTALVGIVATPGMIALTSNPEGLMLGVKITLAYSMRRLMKANVLVRKPSISHSVASVTTTCVNKTGTLTMDYKEVTKFWIGLSSIEEVPHNLIAPNILELLHQGIGLNTSQPPSRSLSASPRNSTEKAIFEWTVRQLAMDVETLKKSCTILEIEPFNSTNKQSGVLISKNADNTIHVHRKGAAEVIIPMCSHYYESTGIVKVMNKSAKVLFEQILESMVESGLRCIAFAHRKTSIRDYFTFSRQQLILLGIVGLTNPRRSDVRRTMEECGRAGVKFKLITGDNVSTAKVLARKCGILESSFQPEEIVEGEIFRNYTPEERLEKVENIRVMARASPFDKFLMVQSLKQKGHVTAFLGRGIGDAHALREADVGICFGTQGAETIKSESPILTWNKDFPLVLDILRWGRSIYDNTQIYTQFLLTASFVALAIDFVMAISSSEPPGFNAVAVVVAGKVPFPVFQLLWLKLILGTFAALALVVKQPSQELLHKPPRDRNEPVMTDTMLVNICSQTVYQIVVLLTIHFRGKSILQVNSREKDTIILNTYILCQAFAIFNSRILDKNMFEEIHKKKLFWGVMAVTIALQVLLVEVLQRFAGTARLDIDKWGICVSIAAATLPINWLVKCIFDLQKPSYNWLSWKPKIE